MKREKNIAILTIFALLISMAACFALPAAAEGDQIEISTAEQLIALASGDLSGNYVQTADIDLSGKDFAPIGSPAAPFSGKYDGNGYDIKGLTLDTDGSFQGLFGVNCGEIRNVTMAEDCSISGSSYVGAIAGFNQGKIENCISRASVGYKAAAESASAKTYGIMSQNLCQWGDNDLTKYEDYQDSVSHSRRPSLMKRIENSDPDVVLFQEVSFNNYKYNNKTITAWDTYLRNTMTDYTIVGTYRANSDKEGVTIAFKNDVFELVDEGMFWLSENPDAPRAQQKKAWDAACVRSAQWVVLRDKVTGQLVIACSTHTDHVGVEARTKGTLLIAERMTALMEKYPEALMAVGGDFNNSPLSQGYINMEAGVYGLLDDSRYVAEERLNNIGTHGDINNLNYVGGEMNTIDYIYVNSATTEASTFYVMNDNYFNLRPSDHEGVFADIKVRENNFVGGICGANGGELSNIVAEGEVDGGAVFGAGSIMANALLHGKLQTVLAADPSTENMVGTEVKFEKLPETPNQYTVDKLNQTGGVFELQDGEYAILEGCGQYEIAKVVFRGIPKNCFVGSVFTFEVADGEEVYLNGEPYEGRSIVVPKEGAVITVVSPIKTVTEPIVGGDFSVVNIEDFLYLYENLSFFQSRSIIIHLRCDIDLSDARLADFKGFTNPGFSMEGYGHTIKNWGSKQAPGGIGFFRITAGNGGMRFVRNLNFVNCHVAGHSAAVLCAVSHANAGLADLSTELELSGISFDQCSMKSNAQSSAMLLSRYGSTTKDYTVNISDIRITNSEIDASSREHIGFVVGKIRSAESGIGTFNISDCYLYGNTVKNAVQGVGFVGGSVEAKTYVNFKNIGVFNNTASGSQMSYLTADSGNTSIVSAKGLMFKDNTIDSEETFMMAGVDSVASATIESLWCDAQLTAFFEGKTESYTATDAAIFASGEAGWGMNSLLETPSFWWMMDREGNYKPCQKDQRLCKVELQLQESTVSYLNAGTEMPLPDIGKGIYEIMAGESSVTDGVLLVKSDTVLAGKIPVSQVKAPVEGGNYTIHSIEDWMVLHQNIEYFRDRDVTIHLLCDIDLSAEAAAEFTYFKNPAFSFDGHNHTIKNWGSEETPAAANALFYITDGLFGMEAIRNLKLEDCYQKGATGNQAILYSLAHGNDGLAGLPTEFTLENIHFNRCSVITQGECGAFLLSRYGVADAEFKVTVQDCSVRNSYLDAAGTAHKGLLIGKPRKANLAAVFEISDCLLEGNTIANAGICAGFIVGSVETGGSKVEISNIGVIDNKLSGTEIGAYVGYCSYGGEIRLESALFAGNMMETESAYLAQDTESGVFSFEKVYGDMASLNGASSGDASLKFSPDAPMVKSGEAGWRLNKEMENPRYYWGMAAGKYIRTDGEHRMVKVSFALENETVVKEFYANGGDAIALMVEQDPNATFSLGEEALSGESYLLPLGEEEIEITVYTKDITLFTPRVSAVNAAVSEGTYSIRNLADWLYLFDHTDYFNDEKITIVLKTDLDLSVADATRFGGFSNAKFSFDGDGHTLSGWTSLEKATTQYAALFIKYAGQKICNLKIEGFKVGGGYGRSLLVGGYTRTESLEISNVHIKDSQVDATDSGNQMSLFFARPNATAASGAVITIKDCSAEGCSLVNTSGARINNSGILVGSAYNNFGYNLTNILIKDCRVVLNTGAGGIVVGAVESSSQLTMENIGVFGCSFEPNATNEIPGVFVGEMSGTAGLAMQGCMAADNTADGRERLAMACHSKATVTVSAKNCLVDFTPLVAMSTNNSDGITSGTPTTLAGVEKLASSAFKSGEAAWEMNQKFGGASWLVGQEKDYPVLSGAGYAEPRRIIFGEDAAFTNALGMLFAEDFARLPKESGHWLYGGELVKADGVYTADTVLIQEAHNCLNPVSFGEDQHKLICTTEGCGAEVLVDCAFNHSIANGDGVTATHYRLCLCGNSKAEQCALKTEALGDGTHRHSCSDCNYASAPERCSFENYAHIEGTDTHQGRCCHCGGASAAEQCEMDIMVDRRPEIGVEGSATHLCNKGCGHYYTASIKALGDCSGEGEISIADVVLLLRVVSGELNAEEIDCIAGNVYTEDGYTENGGITTADALALLKYVVKNS